MCGVFVYWSDRQELALVRAFQYAKRDEVSSLFALLAVTEGCGRTQCDQIPNMMDSIPLSPAASRLELPALLPEGEGQGEQRDECEKGQEIPRQRQADDQRRNRDRD